MWRSSSAAGCAEDREPCHRNDLPVLGRQHTRRIAGPGFIDLRLHGAGVAGALGMEPQLGGGIAEGGEGSDRGKLAPAQAQPRAGVDVAVGELDQVAPEVRRYACQVLQHLRILCRNLP